MRPSGSAASPSPTVDEPPLLTLLSWVWVAFTIEIDNAFEAIAAPHIGHRFQISLPMWTNGLRLVDDDGVTVDELQSRARAGVNLGGLERWGYLAIGDEHGHRKGFGTNSGLRGTTVLRPTRAGQFARRTWPRAVAVVEEAQRERFGSDHVDALVRALAGACGDTAASMPWSPPEIAPSDGFRTTLSSAHDLIELEPLPLVARLGQVLTAYTLAFEDAAPVSLPLAANVLRVIDAGVAHVRDLPRQSGVSKEAVAMATGWLQRHRYASAEPQRSISLTASGRSALELYRSVVSQLDHPQLRAALDAIVSQRGALSAGLEPQSGGWRGMRPYVTHTNALLADPTTALPWQPMVLHRGGWPDGS